MKAKKVPMKKKKAPKPKNQDEPIIQVPKAGLKLLHHANQQEQKKVVAVIVSFVSIISFDNLFTSIEQKSEEGTKVLVYSCDALYLPKLLHMFQGEPENETDRELMGHIKQLHPDCVVFNWECSEGYSGGDVVEGKENLFRFLKVILDRGHMAMFSDWSLRSLIKKWDNAVLGPNPFVTLGETAKGIDLFFDEKVLEECPSAQLQIVGEMAEGGRCLVSTLPGTIVYSVDKVKAETEAYKLDILTISLNSKIDKKFMCKIKKHQGSAGHVLLTYKSGGRLLTSMGHWIELMKIDTSEKKLFHIAAEEYGVGFAELMKKQYQELSGEQKVKYRSKKAAYFVQNQAPCENMSRKKKKGKL